MGFFKRAANELGDDDPGAEIERLVEAAAAPDIDGPLAPTTIYRPDPEAPSSDPSSDLAGDAGDAGDIGNIGDPPDLPDLPDSSP